MKKLAFVLTLLVSSLIQNALATPIISIEPNDIEVTSPENIFVDIRISGLQSGGSNNLLGAWELDFTYDPNIFVFLPNPPAGLGSSLGDIAFGEAINLSSPVTTPGLFHLGELSFLEGDSLTCFFCLAPFLEDLQGDSFILATVGLFLPSTSIFTGTTFLNIENVVLSDANGNSIVGASSVNAEIRVIPEPEILLLLAFGLISRRLTHKITSI